MRLETAIELGTKTLSAKNTVLVKLLRYNILKIFRLCKVLDCKKIQRLETKTLQNLADSVNLNE